MSLIFIISLPRSGSTLLQKILSSSRHVKTDPETWFLLPLISWYSDVEIQTSYGFKDYRKAMNDFLDETKLKKYKKMLNENITKIYTESDRKYYIDKTPRYTLILKELIDTFPDAKFIVLTRNPLSIINSIINTWGKKKRWIIRNYFFDIYIGLSNIISTLKQEHKNVIHIRYEDLVTEPEDVINVLSEKLDLKDISINLKDSNTSLSSATMGDKTGQKKYKSIANKSLSKLDSITNIYRKTFLKKYLNQIGVENLRILGYDYSLLKLSLKKHKVGFKYLIRDLFETLFQLAKIFINLRRIKMKIFKKQKMYGELN